MKTIDLILWVGFGKGDRPVELTTELGDGNEDD